MCTDQGECRAISIRTGFVMKCGPSSSRTCTSRWIIRTSSMRRRSRSWHVWQRRRRRDLRRIPNASTQRGKPRSASGLNGGESGRRRNSTRTTVQSGSGSRLGRWASRRSIFQGEATGSQSRRSHLCELFWLWSECWLRRAVIHQVASFTWHLPGSEAFGIG